MAASKTTKRPSSQTPADKDVHEHVRLLQNREPPKKVSDTLLRPKPAATLILLDQSGPEPTVLMGRRNSKVRFMPGKFVFPGGRIEPGDRKMNIAGTLPEVVEAKLDSLRGSRNPKLARALALAAIRETFEETGLLLGSKEFGAPENPPHGAWSEFASHGVFPDLESVRFVARAITPPGRARRFDASFLVMDVEAIAHRVDGIVGPDAELVELVRVPLSEAMGLDLPTITHVVLRELATRLEAGMSHHLPVPLFRELNRKWTRSEL